MILVLAACGLFALSGLVSHRYGWAQNALVLVVSVALVVIQFTYPRFL